MALKPFARFAALPLALAAVACVPPPHPPTASPGPAALSSAPQSEYRLGPGDEIDIAFSKTPEFNSRQIVRADGAISLAGLEPPAPIELIAGDLSVRELRRELAEVYSRELKNPEITVTIRAYGSSVVYVTGEVGRPGPVPFAGSMTAMQALAAAEGVKPSGRLRQVLVMRPVQGGRAEWRVVDLERAFKNGDFSGDLPLSPRDIVYVPRSGIGDVGAFVDLYIRKVLPIEPGVGFQIQ